MNDRVQYQYQRLSKAFSNGSLPMAIWPFRSPYCWRVDRSVDAHPIASFRKTIDGAPNRYWTLSIQSDPFDTGSVAETPTIGGECHGREDTAQE